MKDKDLHDIIKNRMNDYESPIDLDMEWQAFSKKKDRKKFFFWLSILLALALAGAIAYLVYQGQELNLPIVKENTETPSVTVELGVTTPVENDILRNSKKDRIIAQDVLGEKPTRTKERDKVSALKQSSQIVKKQSKQNKFYKLNEADTSVKEGIRIFEKSTDLILKKEELATTEAKELYPSNLQKERSSLEGHGFFISALEKKEELSTLTSAAATIDFEYLIDQEKVSSSVKRKIELYAGGGLYTTQQIFTAKHEGEEAYQKLRQDSETNLETYSCDLGFNYFLSEKSFLRLGLNYTQWYDRFNYNYEQDKIYDLENVLLKIIKREPLGQVEEIYGDTSVLGTQTVKLTRFNQYVTLSANLEFGYYFFQKNKWKLGIGGGLNWSFYGRSKGTIAAQEPNEFVANSDVYRKSFGLGVVSKVHIDYQLNPRWTIELSPETVYSLSSITVENNALKAHLFRLGLGLGLKYKL